MRRNRIGLAVLAFAFVCRSTNAYAQDLVPPVLETFVDAPYPEDAQKAGLAGDVVLVLDIDAQGKVTSATVKESAGHGFDEAAIDAAKKFAFKPATKDGKPVA